MKKWSTKKTVITISITLIIVLLVFMGVFIGITKADRLNISANDLAEMKTLAHKYTNIRHRLGVANPDTNPNTVGAPVLSDSDMSTEFAAQMTEYVKDLRETPNPGVNDDFATFLRVFDIRREGKDLGAFMKEWTLLTYAPFYKTDNLIYSGDTMDYYFKFTLVGGRWIMQDARELYPRSEVSLEEKDVAEIKKQVNPPIDPLELRSTTISETSYIPEYIVKLDEEATKKITNKWAVDYKTIEAMANSTR